MPHSPDLIWRLRAWAYHRQRLNHAAPSPSAALGEVLAVYSSHPTAPLTLLARTPTLTAGAFSQLEQAREVVRLPAMRQSIFLLPTATASRIFAATRQPVEQHDRRLRYARLEWDDYARLKPLVLEHTQTPIAADALQQALIAADPALGAARLMTGVRLMSLEGLVLRIGSSLRSDSLRYVATDAWLGHPLDDLDPDGALRWLADAYLRAYGPVRVADFAWWAGVPRRRAHAAVHAAYEPSGLTTIGPDLLLPADLYDAYTSVEPPPTAALDLLPKWDAYTMGYAPDGRQRLVDDAHLPLAYSTARVGAGATSGDGLPLVLRAGRAIASWSHRFTGDRLHVTIRPFEPAADPLSDLAESAFTLIAELLGATRLTLTIEPSAMQAAVNPELIEEA